MTPAQRRDRGVGGLFQRHDHPDCPPSGPDGTRPAHRCRGRWVGTLDVWDDSRKRRKYVYGRTQKEARTKLATAVRERDQGVLVVSSLTVGGWLKHWLAKVAAREVRPQTLAGYQSKVSTLIVPHLGAHRLTALRPEHIRDWHERLATDGGRHGQPLAPATILQAHNILKKSLRDATNEGKLAVSPADRVKSPRLARQERASLTVEQATRLLAAAGQDARWWLAAFYGMRQGEVLGLCWRDVDFDGRTLTIRQTLQIGADRLVVFGPPKTSGSQRTMPMLAPISLRLRLHQPAGVDPDALVFTDSAGQPVKPWNDSRAWHSLLASADLPQLPLHSARHTAASVMEAAGVPDRLIMQILGHSQVQMTHRYTHADLERQEAALTAALGVLAIE